jgi:hypothetical protein
MASTLGDFDQSMKLIVAGVRLNLKFYFNFLQMSFFIARRMNRRPPKLNFAHARSNSQRHQQTSAQRAQKRRHRIRCGRIVSRQMPSQRPILHFGVERFADRFDRNVAMVRLLLRRIRSWHSSLVLLSPNLAETGTFLQTVRSGFIGFIRLLDLSAAKYHSTR